MLRLRLIQHSSSIYCSFVTKFDDQIRSLYDCFQDFSTDTMIAMNQLASKQPHDHEDFSELRVEKKL